MTGEGVFAAHVSILLKTLALYTIMVTVLLSGEGRLRTISLRARLFLGKMWSVLG